MRNRCRFFVCRSTCARIFFQKSLVALDVGGGRLSIRLSVSRRSYVPIFDSQALETTDVENLRRPLGVSKFDLELFKPFQLFELFDRSTIRLAGLCTRRAKANIDLTHFPPLSPSLRLPVGYRYSEITQLLTTDSIFLPPGVSSFAAISAIRVIRSKCARSHLCHSSAISPMPVSQTIQTRSFSDGTA